MAEPTAAGVLTGAGGLDGHVGGRGTRSAGRSVGGLAGGPDRRRSSALSRSDRRVRAELDDEAALLVTVERDERVVGMALVVPFRADDGSGRARPGWGHVSMVFVRPEHQRTGVGSEVMAKILASRGAQTLSLWTRESNVAARALYRRFGFVATADRKALHDGEPIGRWVRSPSEPLG